MALVSFAVGIAVIGPGLSRGALFQLDRSLIPHPPFPWGTFGLGPEIPRDAPLSAIIWLASQLLGAPSVSKWLMVLTISIAWCGMFRLTSAHAGLPLAMMSGFLYALSPYLLTRLAVGHESMGIAAAVLPWVLASLSDVRSTWRKVFLACVALCIAGSFGGILAGLVLASRGVRRAGRRRLLAHGSALLAASSMWLVPGVVVMLGSPKLSPASSFPNGTRTVADLLELAAGAGFWQPSLEIAGPSDLLTGIAGFVLLGLAIIGTTRLPSVWRATAASMAGVTFIMSLASAVPGLRTVTDWFTSTALGVPFREAQRYLLLYVCWMTAAAPVGAIVLVRRYRSFRELIIVAPLAAGLVLGAPGLWGLGGRLDPIDIPAGWNLARDIINDGGGTTLTLPWNRYITLRFANVPRSLNPMPKFLGSDVLVASDLGLGGSSHERTDRREYDASLVAFHLIEGETTTIVDDLARLGVHWVVLLHEGPYELYVPGLLDATGLLKVLERPDIELYEVPGWSGSAVTADGSPVEVSGGLGPIADPSVDRPFVWFRAFQRGWLRGFRSVGSVEPGVLSVPGGSGLVWFWPALLCAVTYLGVGLTSAFCLVRRPRTA